MSKWTNEERETTVNLCAADSVVRVWSNIPKHINAFRKKADVVEVASGVVEGQPWASFTIPVDRYDPARGVRSKRTLTPEQRQERADRLAKVRKHG